MPTLQQLYGALQKADAAGDTEAARAIARELAGQAQGIHQQALASAGFDADGNAPRNTDAAGDLGITGRLLAGTGYGADQAGSAMAQMAWNAVNPKSKFNPAAGIPGAGALVEFEKQLLGAFAPNAADDADKAIRERAAAQQQEYQRGGLGDTWSGKIGNVVGGAAATAPLMMVGGPATGFLAKTGQAAMMGAAQAGATMPVVDGDFLTQKLKQMGIGAGAGAAGSTVLQGLGRAAEAVLPSNATAWILNKVAGGANKSPTAAEGERLAQQTGVMLTPAQVSGSKSMTAAENAARQSIFSRELANQGDQARVAQLADYFDRTADGITKSAASPAIAGQQIQAATRGVVSKLENMRAETAGRDFGAIRALTKGQASIVPQNANDALQGMVADFEGIGTPSADAIANFARRQLANVNPSTGAGAPAMGNLDKLMQLRSYLSKVAGGQAKISGDNVDRMLSAKLLGAIDQDIESGAQQIGGDLGGMLSQANQRYRAFSQQIDSVKASPLGKILGEDMAGAIQSGGFNTLAPETVIDRLSKLTPTHLGVVRGMLEKENPEAWQVFKRSLLESALEKAKQFPASEGANTAVLRPNVLIKSLGDSAQLRAVFSPQELSQITAGLDVARRLSDKTGYNFSGTASQAEALSMMNSLKDMSLKGAASVGGQALGTRKIAQLMTDANGRAALLKLSRLPPQSNEARRLAAQIAALVGVQDAGGNQTQGNQQQP